jgi:hypothetical protein
MKMIITLGFLFSIAVVASGQRSKPISHAHAMQIIHACKAGLRPACDEEPISEVIQRYKLGDVSLLTPLLKTSESTTEPSQKSLMSFMEKSFSGTPLGI